MGHIKPKFIITITLILSTFGCAVKPMPQENIQIEQQIEQKEIEKTKAEQTIEVTKEMIEEYAMIHMISDLKVAEYYLTHPEYAKQNPYKPTKEDIVFYESKFLESVFPEFKKVAEKEGYARARSIYMNTNPATGAPFRDFGTTWQSKRKVAEAVSKSRLIDEEVPVAIMLYENNRIDEALKHIQKAVDADPSSPTLLYDLGVMQMKKGNHYEAIEAFKSSIKYLKGTGYTNVNLAIHPKVYLGASNNLALIYMGLDMNEEAVKVLEEALKSFPKDEDTNWNLVTAYYSMNDAEKAMPHLINYIKLDPNNAEAHNILGLLYYQREFYESAIEEFQTAIRLDPDKKQYHHNAGLTLAQLGRYGEAILEFKSASGLEEGKDMRQKFIEEHEANKWRELYNEGVSAMEEGDTTRPIELFNSALELNPDMVEAHVNLGFIYGRQQNLEKQIYHFEEASRLQPEMADIRYSLGQAYLDAGMYEKAIDELRKTTELNPSSKDAHFNLGTTFFKIGNYDDAINEYEICLELSPDWFEAHTNLGSCYIKTGNIKEAMKHFTQAVQLRPTSAEAHYNLGIAYMRIEKYIEAGVSFEKALILNPNHKQARIMQAEIKIYQGN